MPVAAALLNFVLKAMSSCCTAIQPCSHYAMVTSLLLCLQAGIDPMYQYSLAYFVKLFNHCVDAAAGSDDLPTRLQVWDARALLCVGRQVSLPCICLT